MDPPAEIRAASALLRLLVATAPGAAASIYAVDGSDLRLWTTAPIPEGADPAPWRPMPPPIAEALAAAGPVAFDPAALGLDAAFGLLHRVAGAGGATIGLVTLFATAGELRRPECAEALADVALAATPLLATLDRRPPTTAPMRSEPPDARAPQTEVLPRLAAARMIEAARLRRDERWSLFLIDLDRFYAVNDALGEAAGDALLAAIAARFETCLDPGDRLARLEGDRFVVLAARVPQSAAQFATRLLAATREPLMLAGRSVVIHASIGVVAGFDAATPTRAVLNQADAALRQAKAEGRNRVVLHEPGRDAAAAEVSRLELDLAEAPFRGQMRLVYQGYVDLASGKVSGFEALLRWRHPTRGELAPASFIPLAESSGLILPLGAWALRMALNAARRWPQALTLSVNVSALQFHQPDFVAQVLAALVDSGVAPERLELEITETVLMRDNPETTAQLEALIAKGVRIALDDFGTGYSALAYLGRLPHHRIKLDRSFVQDLGNPATVELVRAIIALARKTGVSVTAEGVERPDQLSMVRSMGFTHAQGFVTGRPVADPVAPDDAGSAAPDMMAAPRFGHAIRS